MGVIISTEAKDQNAVIVRVSMSYDELIQLKGHMEKIHIFSENSVDVDTHVSSRGRNESTKYFLVPKIYKHNLVANKKAKCQRIDTGETTIFIYSISNY